MKKIITLLMICTSLAFSQGKQGNSQGIYALFNVVAVQDANLALDSSGIIAKIAVDVGDQVKKGQVLLALANADKEANVRIQEAQSRAIEQQYLFAKKQYERYADTQDAVDRNTLDRYYSDYKNLQNSFLQSKYNVKLQRELYNKTILRAPFDGIIASKEVQLGDGVGANNTKLFRLISKEVKMVLEFDVKYIHQVKVGDAFYFSLDGSKPRYAKITKVYPTADEKTRKVKAEASVSGLVAGTFGDGLILKAK